MDGLGQAGDEAHASFVAFVQSRQHALLRSAYLVTGDRWLAEDLLQGALTKLALRWHRVREGDPEAFVRTVLYRDMVSWWRRHRRESLTADPADRASTESAPDDSDALASRLYLEAALGELTRKQRAVLVLRYFEDLSEAQAADVLGVSVGTIKSQTHAALRRLRQSIGELDLLGATEELR